MPELDAIRPLPDVLRHMPRALSSHHALLTRAERTGDNRHDDRKKLRA
jgi:hypothetical protein